jgi:hypothetical protein
LSGAPIEVSATYAVSAEMLWEELRHIDRHVRWMADAESLSFTGDQREGVGTTFLCRTKVGPLVTNDVLTITSWEPNNEMGVKHSGIVTGEGAFTLVALDDDHVRLEWREHLAFPWWGLGVVGAYVARPVLRAIWRGNLRRLGEQLSSSR